MVCTTSVWKYLASAANNWKKSAFTARMRVLTPPGEETHRVVRFFSA
jgi:hypothetical protein